MIRKIRLVALFISLLAVQACSVIESIWPPASTSVPAAPPPPPPVRIIFAEQDSLLTDFDIPGYPQVHSNWVDSVYETLSPRGRLGQLVTVFTFSDVSDRTVSRLMRSMRSDSVGGVIFSRGTSGALRMLVDSLKSLVRVPLLLSADFETGPGMRLSDGFRIPSMMAIAATRSTDLAYRAGLAVASEARELGIAQNYAPVCDVNNNPLNPIINARSFGEDRELVAEMAEAIMRGMQDGGLIATAKHFPGHGDTESDSHTALPLLRLDRARLDSVELYPFRRLIDAGVMAVMPGHLAVPGVTGDSSMPATLSPLLLDSLLRREWGFRGLVVSDAMNMKALTRTRVRNIPAAAIAAGVDMLLMPEDASSAIDSLAAALRRGELDSMRIARSVKRVLAMKEWAGRHAQPADSSAVRRLRTERHLQLTDHIAQRAVTLLGNESGLVPCSVAGRRIGLISLTREDRTPGAEKFAEELRNAGANVTHVRVEAGSKANGNGLRDSLKNADLLFVAGYIAVVNGTGSIGISAAHRKALTQIEALGKPVVVLSFGSPYFCASYPKADAWICAYGDDESSLRAATALISGDIPARGRLPVSIPGIAGFGMGAQTPTNEELEAGRIAAQFASVDSLILSKIRDKAFPGGQLFVRLPDGNVYQRSYGRLHYGNDGAPVSDSTLYDLASLTKVIATTPAVMRLYEEGRIALDSAAASYLPEFGVNGKEGITIRQLLQHRSGLEAFRQFHPAMKSEQEVLQVIYSMAPQYPPGSRVQYSDLGMIVLGKIVERVTGLRLNVFVRQMLFEPLCMRNTMFLPADSLRSHIAPTEIDTSWRMRLLQGEVHDETASLLGGVSGNAGLFSTAADLGLFAEMMLHLGGAPDTQLFRPSTIERFTSRQYARDSRALGWDLRSVTGSSAGHYFSMRSYGHTGFTGTSIWIDPIADTYVIFLTNRVHPTRSNSALPRFRSQLHDAIREAISALRN